MGGGGEFSDYDVPDRSTRTTRGTTRLAEERMSRREVDPALLPKGRRLICAAASPVVLGCDITGSMDVLPKIFFGKVPNVVREITQREYLRGMEFSVGGIGDVIGDDAPLQFGDFAAPKEIGDWLSRIYAERGGGAQGNESYELAAWFYAYRYELPNAEMPFLFFTGDEGFRERLSGRELNQRFGGENRDTTADEVFKDLLKKFNGNVFLIHRVYRGPVRDDDDIVRDWQRVIGAERVVLLESDQAVADVILGVIAVVGGTRTLEEYCDDMANRTDVDTGEPDPQTPERIAEVRHTLAGIGRVPRGEVPKKRKRGEWL
jgi:hypothetical protein